MLTQHQGGENTLNPLGWEDQFSPTWEMPVSLPVCSLCWHMPRESGVQWWVGGSSALCLPSTLAQEVLAARRGQKHPHTALQLQASLEAGPELHLSCTGIALLQPSQEKPGDREQQPPFASSSPSTQAPTGAGGSARAVHHEATAPQACPQAAGTPVGRAGAAGELAPKHKALQPQATLGGGRAHAASENTICT